MKLKINMTKIQLMRLINKYLVLLFANLILVFATVIFYNGFNIVAGGVSGVAIIINNFFDGFLDVTAYVITGILLIASFFTLGKKVTVRSLFSTLMYPVLLTIVYRIFECFSFDEWFTANIAAMGSEYYLINYFLCAVFGGLLCGLSVGLAFLVGGTTGGFDILVLIIKKYYKNSNESLINFIVDGTIIVAGIVVSILKPIFYDGVEASSLNYGIIFAESGLNILSAICCAATIQIVYITRNNSISCEIITDKWEELNKYFINELERGTTIYDVTGGYKFEKRKLIRVVIHKKEYEKVIEKVREIDPNAFSTFTFTKQVLGNGFSVNNPYE